MDPGRRRPERVLRAAAELGYRPDTAAQVLRRSRSRHIGVLFTMRQPFDVDLVEAIYPAADRHGYHVVLGAIRAGFNVPGDVSVVGYDDSGPGTAVVH